MDIAESKKQWRHYEDIIVQWIKNKQYIPSQETMDEVYFYFYNQKYFKDLYVKAMIAVYSRIPIHSNHLHLRKVRVHAKCLTTSYIILFMKMKLYKDNISFNLKTYDIEDFCSDLFHRVFDELDDFYSGSSWSFFWFKTILYLRKARQPLAYKEYIVYIEADETTEFLSKNNYWNFGIEDELIVNETMKEIIDRARSVSIRFIGPERKCCQTIIKHLVLNHEIPKNIIGSYYNALGKEKTNFFIQYCKFELRFILIDVMGIERISEIQDVIEITDENQHFNFIERKAKEDNPLWRVKK